MGSERFEQRAVISGVGQSAIDRVVPRSGFQLTLDAVMAAIADAGLGVDDIDGLAMFPGGGAANLPGYANGSDVSNSGHGVRYVPRSAKRDDICSVFVPMALSGLRFHVAEPLLWKHLPSAWARFGRVAGFPPTRPAARAFR